MTVLYVILLAIVQGITEFLPVSSFGHLSILENFFGMDHNAGVLLEAMLHVGTLGAVFMTFQKDIRHILYEILDMTMDIVGNFHLYFYNKRTGKQLHYARIISNTYRKFVVLLLVSMIPTMFLGYTSRRLVVLVADSTLVSSAGLLITGIVLLVIDLSRAGGTKAAKDASLSNAMWIGISQGLSVFPGLSRSGLTISAGLMSGFSRTFAVKYSYILSIPAILGSLVMELGQFGSPAMTVGLGFTYVLGMVISGIVASFVIRYCLKLVQKGRFRGFAIYCFVIGFVTLIMNYVVTIHRQYSARRFAMNMAKSRDIQGKMPSPKVIWNAF